jgi:glycosyltransferase involved in cell wall biosynthesis
MMKILVLTHSYPDEINKWRGVFIQEQVKALSIKHEVTLVYFKVDYSHFSPFTRYSFKETRNGRITEYEVTTARSFPVINQVKYLTNTYRFIKKEIFQKQKPDIIHCHLSYPAGFLGTIIQKLDGIPCIITEHTWIKKYFRSAIHKLCVKYALNNCSCILPVSEALKDDIQNYSRNKIRVVPNVIDSARFPLIKKEKGEYLNFGLLGGLSNYRKGLDILMESASMLPLMNFRIHIGGTGTLIDVFKKKARDLDIEEKCIYYGEIKPEKVTEFYSQLDFFVLASRDETFGMVVIEAMSCGLPVIATRCGGPAEIVKPFTGLLVQSENVHELADAIFKMSGTLDSYDRASIKKYASDTYGYEAFINYISPVYEEIVRKDL